MLFVPLALAALISGQTPPAAKEKASIGEPVQQQKARSKTGQALKVYTTKSSMRSESTGGSDQIFIPFKTPTLPVANVSITTPKVTYSEGKQAKHPRIDYSFEYTLTPNGASEPLALRYKLEQLDTNVTPNAWQHRSDGVISFEMPRIEGFGPTGIYVHSGSETQEPGTYRLRGWVTESVKANPGLTLSSVDLTFTVNP